jgi:hypothetical protein
MFHSRDKKICFIKSTDNKNNIIYNGSNFDTISNDERDEIMKKPYGYDYILVPYNDKTNDTKLMIEEYDKYIKTIENISEITEGKINMYRTGTIANTSLCLFNKFNDNKERLSSNRTTSELEKIKEHEFKFLENGGGVRVGDKGYEGIGYKYDINSYYPSLMCSKTLKFPICAGELIDITTEEVEHKRFVKFGVYHAEIECEDDKIFTTIGTNMYSHTEINYAKKLGLKINILGQCIVWNDDQLVTFNSVFDKFVKYLYPKKKLDKTIKLILNSLWGGLVQKRGGIFTHKIKYEDIDPQKNIIIRTNPIDDTYCMLTTKNTIKFFKTTYARINPFLLGMARVTMHKTFEKIGYENVLWSHTDSVVTKISLNKQIKQNYDLGNWKYEGCCKNLKIYNKNICKGNFQ